MPRRNKYKVNNESFSDEDFIKDCPRHKLIPTILPKTSRIIVMGDIHGDLNLAIKSFKLAKLIDDELNWIAQPPNTVVVQVGDQIDSCRPTPEMDCNKDRNKDDKFEDIKVLEFFNDMQKKAERKGGNVYSLLGNHELMNVQGSFNYVSYDNLHQFYYQSNKIEYRGEQGRKDAFAPGGPMSNMLACTRPSILIIGSNMFVHAGVLPALTKYLDYYNIDANSKLKYLNGIVRRWLLNKLNDKDQEELRKIVIENMELSPFWTRIYGSIPKDTQMNTPICSDHIKPVLQVFKIGTVIVGHTPQMKSDSYGINGTCYEKDKNTLYRVDGGFSRGFRVFNSNTIIQVLEILDDNQFNIYTDYNL